MEAIREDELAAAANGINTVTTKLLAFALGASTAGIAGVFNAAKLTIVSPDQFTFTVSFTVLAMVVLGGMGNFWGVAVGAFVIYTIQNVVLNQLNQFFDNVQRARSSRTSTSSSSSSCCTASRWSLMMLLRPEGLFPNSRRKRELHTAGGRARRGRAEPHGRARPRRAGDDEPRPRRPAAAAAEPPPNPASRTRSPGASAAWSPSTRSTSPSRRARSSASSGPTAPARRRSSTSCRDHRPDRRARSSSAAGG